MNGTAERLTYTRVIDSTYNSGHGATCGGAHHNDRAELFLCDNCGEQVFRTVRYDDNGKARYGNAHPVHHSSNGARIYYCWSLHTCDTESVELHQQAVAAQLAAGALLKGQAVVVVKGRKIAHGTAGVVFWTGKDGYGTDKVGFATQDGTKHFTAASNVQVQP